MTLNDGEDQGIGSSTTTAYTYAWTGLCEPACGDKRRGATSEEAGGMKHLMGCDETGEPLFFEW